jgi:hypothetical protein
MITLHKIQFIHAKNQEEVWNIYRNLKLKRKGKTIKEILEEIAKNWNELANIEVSEEKAKDLLSLQKIKKTPSKLVSLLNQTKDPELRNWLREEIKRMVEGQNEDLF